MKNEYLIEDNLSYLDKIKNNSIHLCYIDPPYFTNRDFGDFTDIWKSRKEYLIFLEERIRKIYKTLTSSGVLVVHVNQVCSHSIKLLLDEVFGEKSFINEIIWKTTGNSKTKIKLPCSHDTLFVYSKGKNYTYNPIYFPYDENYRQESNIKLDKDGREYITTALKNNQPNINKRPNLRYEWKGNLFQWHVSLEKMKLLEKQDRLSYSEKSSIPRVKRYLDEMEGIPLRDVWTDIGSIQRGEKLDYATQKPEKLIQRILTLFSKEGDNILDCFAGSGVVGICCIQMKRDFFLCDFNPKGKEIFNIAKQRLDNSLLIH